MKRYDIDGEIPQQAIAGEWVRWEDVRKQLPEGMEHCFIQFKECEVCQRGRLTAANWIDYGCPHCERDKLHKDLQEIRALALAAVQLVPEDENIAGLRILAKEARELFMGKDKKTIAKLEDELHNLRNAHTVALRSLQRSPGVNWVFGTKPGDKTQCRYSLIITSLTHAVNGGLEIEVQLP